MRIVIKVGTSTLAHSTGLMNVRRVELLCSVLRDVKNAGHEVVLVSSGAVSAKENTVRQDTRDASISKSDIILVNLLFIHFLLNIYLTENHLSANSVFCT